MDCDRLTRTHFWPETIEFLRRLSQLLPKNGVVINIGAYWESSTISLLMDRPDLFAFSIDPEICEEGLENLKRFKMEDRVIRVLAKSQEIDWPFEVDAVYIDGDHSYEACRSDYDLWAPRLKKGGLLFFHDYGTPHTPGVVKAVDEIRDKYQYLGKDLDIDKGVLVAFRK